MDSLSDHYRRMVGLDSDWGIANVDLDTEALTLTLAVEYVGKRVVCPECNQACAKKDHAAERSWRHLDAMQFQTVLTAGVVRGLWHQDRGRSMGRKTQSLHAHVRGVRH